MQLTKARLHGQPAWRWDAPNGTAFYLQRTYNNKWAWWRDERDQSSSQVFDTLDALKAHLAHAFEGELT